MSTSSDMLALQRLYHWEGTAPHRVCFTQPVGQGVVKTFTWAEVAHEVRCMASYLQTLNYPPGSRIAIWGKNTAHWLMADLAIMMAGAWALTSQFWAYAQNHPVVFQALAGGSAAALATALGTVPVMLSQRLSERTQDTLFGFGAGVGSVVAQVAKQLDAQVQPFMIVVEGDAVFYRSE